MVALTQSPGAPVNVKTAGGSTLLNSRLYSFAHENSTSESTNRKAGIFIFAIIALILI
jgi:hypothetical protein